MNKPIIKQIGYKVLTKWGDHLYSFNAWLPPVQDRVTDLLYEVGVLRVPALKGSKLFAFDSEYNATKFAGMMVAGSTSVIYEAILYNPVPSEVCIYSYNEDIIEFWRKRKLPTKHVPGTLACDAIELIEQV